jgi:hypothetical protein
VVGKFFEPGGSYWNRFICASGAARVVLAFVGHAPQWQRKYLGSTLVTTNEWPSETVYYPTGTKPFKWTGGPDTYGQAYMMYLAYRVKPPSGLSRRGLAHGPKGALNKEVKAVLNWEYAGETKSQFHPNWPFSVAVWKTAFQTFQEDVKDQILFQGVPVQLAVKTGAPKGYSVGLPSWQIPAGASGYHTWAKDQCGLVRTNGTCAEWLGYHDIAHAITIVGYNATDFFYLDTCQKRGGNCSWLNPNPYQAHADTWHVSQYFVWQEMRRQQGGYIKYAGPPAERPVR